MVVAALPLLPALPPFAHCQAPPVCLPTRGCSVLCRALRSRTCIEGLRPLAYSTLAELVASCKTELSYDQLAKVVHIFTR